MKILQFANSVEEIPLENISITDQFWKTRIDNNYRVSVMKMLDDYEKAGEAPDPKLVEAQVIFFSNLGIPFSNQLLIED